MSAPATSPGSVANVSLRERLADNRPVLAPGIYDALTALVAEQTGFEALYLSGASIAYTRLGRSDVGLTTFTEVEDTLARITERVFTPVIVDADTGFGNAINLQRTVRGMERAGAAMIQLEDQGFPKRCGHLDGKSVVSTAEMCGKLRAALDARHSAETLILARTDALAIEGLDAALDRAEAYLACGVDALFIEPVQSARELGERGFRIVIFPGGTARAVAHLLQRYYGSLHQHQTTAPMRNVMLDFDQLNALIGTPELMALGQSYDPPGKA